MLQADHAVACCRRGCVCSFPTHFGSCRLNKCIFAEAGNLDAQCGYSLYLIISKLTQHIQIPPLEGASWQAERAFGCSGVGLPVRSSLAQKVELSSICLPISHM